MNLEPSHRCLYSFVSKLVQNFSSEHTILTTKLESFPYLLSYFLIKAFAYKFRHVSPNFITRPKANKHWQKERAEGSCKLEVYKYSQHTSVWLWWNTFFKTVIKLISLENWKIGHLETTTLLCISAINSNCYKKPKDQEKGRNIYKNKNWAITQYYSDIW